MYSKDELLSKNISDLEDIAKELGISVASSDSLDGAVYAILDKQAEVEGNKNPMGTKRKRTRILKKDTDRVYSVNGKDGENFDLKKPAGACPGRTAGAAARAQGNNKKANEEESGRRAQRTSRHYPGSRPACSVPQAQGQKVKGRAGRHCRRRNRYAAPRG